MDFGWNYQWCKNQVTDKLYCCTSLSLLIRKNHQINMRSCQIHLLTFCRAWLEHWQDTFPSQVTSRTLSMLADSPELTSSALTGTLYMCMNMRSFQQGRINQEYWQSAGEAAVIVRTGAAFLSLRKHEPIIDRAKQNHLTSDGAGHWGGSMCGHTCIRKHKHTRPIRIFFPRLPENLICRRGKLKLQKNLGCITKQWQEITFYWVSNEWLFLVHQKHTVWAM